MSTKEKTGSAGRTAGILFILLALAAVAVLGVYIYRQLQPPKAPETAIGYVASETASAPVYDADSGAELGVLVRGSQVAYVAADVETPREDGRVRVVNGEGYVLLDASHLADDLSRTVQVETVYALRGMSLLDETGAVPGCAVEKGMALAVTGFDGLDENGEVLRWQVSCQRGEGYIAAANVRMTEDEALAQYDAELYQLHASRGDSWGGGDAAGLDYYPVEKGAIEGNVMPDEVRALYLNGSAVQYADSYLRVAEGSGVNAFVVDIVDGTAVSYASPVMQQYSPSAYAAAMDTRENFQTNIQKLKAAGYYLIGRITVFNDAHLAADHPEQVICDLEGTPLKISSMYWPSAYDRTVWQYKVDLALEAAALGFNEIQFDYIRFPDGAYSYEKAGTIDYRRRCRGSCCTRRSGSTARGTICPATCSASAPIPTSPPAASTGRPSARRWTPSPACPIPTITAPRGTTSPGSTPTTRYTCSARPRRRGRRRQPLRRRCAHGYRPTTPSASRTTPTARRRWRRRSELCGTPAAAAAL